MMNRLVEGLIALYKFDDGSSSTVTDISGFDNILLNLTIDDLKDVAWGKATLTLNSSTLINSDGSAQNLYNEPTDSATGLTIEDWITPANQIQDGLALVVTFSMRKKDRNFNLGQQGDNYDFRLRTTDNNSNRSSPSKAAQGTATTTPKYLVSTWNAMTRQSHIYVNGNLIVTQLVGDTHANGNLNYVLGFGNELGANRIWSGTFDLLAIYAQHFNEVEVKQNYDAGADEDNPVTFKEAPKIILQNAVLTLTDNLNTTTNNSIKVDDISVGNTSDATKPVQILVLAEPVPHRITNELVALYEFDDGSGNTVADTSGFDNTPLNLTIDDLNNVTWGEGTLTLNASTLISSSGPAQNIYDELTDSATGLTIEAWITPANQTQDGPARIVTFSMGKKNRNFTLGQEGDDYDFRLRTTDNNSNGSRPSTTAQGAVTNASTHVVSTWDAMNGQSHIYVNGNLVTTQSVGDSLANWNPNYLLGIGNELGANRSWLGTLDLVAIYAQYFDEVEVKQNYAAGPDGDNSGITNESPTVALQNAITTLTDNLNTTNSVKVADIAVTDDGIGTNILSLVGEDADLFEITDNSGNPELYIKAGTVLDSINNATLDVRIEVDDTAVGSTPDDTAVLQISVTSIPNEPPMVILENIVTTLAEELDTTNSVKVADIVVTDDGIGTNLLSLIGEDADLFEIFDNSGNSELHIKAGTVLDSINNATLDIGVDVDDTMVGSNPDDSAVLQINVVAEPTNSSWTLLSSTQGDLPEILDTAGNDKHVVMNEIFDIDLDGDQDWIIGSLRTPGLQLFRQESDGSFTRFVLDSYSNLEHASANYDIDNDGDLDIVVGNHTSDGGIHWWENPYPDIEQSWQRRFVDDTLAQTHDFVFADTDADGQSELFAVGRGNKLIQYFIPENPSTAPSWQSKVIVEKLRRGGRTPRGIDAGDVDVDGDIDIIAAGQLFSNTGDGNFELTATVFPDLGESFSEDILFSGMFKVAQLIPGGYAEIAVSSPHENSGPIGWSYWDGDKWIPQVLIADSNKSHSLQVGDINLDGHMDIFSAEERRHDNPNPKTWVFYGDGQGGFETELINQDVGQGIGIHGAKLGDMDNDGDLDIAGQNIFPFNASSQGQVIWLNPVL